MIDCPICLNCIGNTNIYVTKCGHVFHGTCIIKWMTNNNNCPICRAKICETKNNMNDVIMELKTEIHILKHNLNCALMYNANLIYGCGIIFCIICIILVHR